jgi:hypothetical protein
MRYCLVFLSDTGNLYLLLNCFNNLSPIKEECTVLLLLLLLLLCVYSEVLVVKFYYATTTHEKISSFCIDLDRPL